MRISEIQIIPIKPQNGLVAFVSFVLDSNLYLSSIGVITRPQGGYRLTYPTKRVGVKDLNIFYPINKTFAEEIEKEVSAKLEEVMNNYDRYNKTSA
ncbi:MAG TPA: septation protein SpoVG family protein [Patescibacteria group bacterium]